MSNTFHILSFWIFTESFQGSYNFPFNISISEHWDSEKLSHISKNYIDNFLGRGESKNHIISIFIFYRIKLCFVYHVSILNLIYHTCICIYVYDRSKLREDRDCFLCHWQLYSECHVHCLAHRRCSINVL